jgi:hypothetical protein
VTREPREPEKEADHEVRPDRPRRGKPDASEQGRHSKRAEDETDRPSDQADDRTATTAASLWLRARGGAPSSKRS